MTWLAAGLAGITLLRLAVAATVPLAPDETYYWVWSHALAGGYLDHPPMVALWIRGGTALIGQTPLGVRLFGPIAVAAASWLLFDAARTLFADRRAGVAAAVLMNGTLLLGVGSVVMTPDTPLLFFWTATLWAAARPAAAASQAAVDGQAGTVVRQVVLHRHVTNRVAFWWPIAGLLGGLALDSKYTALFLWIGIGSWLLLVPAARLWLRRWQTWTALAIGIAAFAPVLAWNAAHGWAGLIKQGGRVADWNPSRAAGFLGELVGSQIGLVTPAVFGLCMIALAAPLRSRRTVADPRWSLLLALSLPPILVFIQHGFGGRVEGNWPAIIYPALTVAVGGVVAGQARRVRRAGGMLGPAPVPAHYPRWVSFRATWQGLFLDRGMPPADASRHRPVSERLIRLWPAAALLGYAVTALVYLQVAIGLFPLPADRDPIALQLSGWNGLARQIATVAHEQNLRFIAASGYALGSELAWHLPAGTLVIGMDPHWVTTDLPRASLGGARGLLVQDVRQPQPADPGAWMDVQRIGTASRPGIPAVRYALYLVTAGPRSACAVILPHR